MASNTHGESGFIISSPRYSYTRLYIYEVLLINPKVCLGTQTNAFQHNTVKSPTGSSIHVTEWVRATLSLPRSSVLLPAKGKILRDGLNVTAEAGVTSQYQAPSLI